MSIKYFTGSNVAANNYAGKVATLTSMTSFWYPETPPVNNADGVDVKPGTTAKFTRIAAKVHNTSALKIKGGKGRGTMCIAKYELGKMWKYRKTLKKLMTAAGFAATGTSKGERSMYNNKGNGNTGDTARPKNAQQTPLADSYELWPMDAGK
jgi:hypothetical protein